MTTRDLAPRLAGVAVLGAAWGACLWLRELMPQAPRDPTLLQLMLLLASFALTSLGLLLLFKGEHLFGPRRSGHGPRGLPTARRRLKNGPRSIDGFADDRTVLADMLVERDRRRRD